MFYVREYLLYRSVATQVSSARQSLTMRCKHLRCSEWEPVDPLRKNHELTDNINKILIHPIKRTLPNRKVLNSPNWARTSDIMINSHALYRLSYGGK